MWYIKSSFIMNSVHVSCSIVHVFAKWQEVLEKCWGTGELQAEFKDSLQSIQASFATFACQRGFCMFVADTLGWYMLIHNT